MTTTFKINKWLLQWAGLGLSNHILNFMSFSFSVPVWVHWAANFFFSKPSIFKALYWLGQTGSDGLGFFDGPLEIWQEFNSMQTAMRQFWEFNFMQTNEPRVWCDQFWDVLSTRNTRLDDLFLKVDCCFSYITFSLL